MLQEITGEADITTGLITYDRYGNTGAESTVGFFLNTIPIQLVDDQHSWIGTAEYRRFRAIKPPVLALLLFERHSV